MNKKRRKAIEARLKEQFGVCNKALLRKAKKYFNEYKLLNKVSKST